MASGVPLEPGMTATGIFVPGEAVPGKAIPGYLGPAPAYGITITTTPQLIAAAPASGRARVTGLLAITSTTGTIYLGGAGVSSANGAAVSSGPLLLSLFPGDQLYAATATGTATITVLQSGA